MRRKLVRDTCRMWICLRWRCGGDKGEEIQRKSDLSFHLCMPCSRICSCWARDLASSRPDIENPSEGHTCGEKKVLGLVKGRSNKPRRNRNSLVESTWRLRRLGIQVSFLSAFWAMTSYFGLGQPSQLTFAARRSASCDRF